MSLDVVTLNLPRIAIESKGDQDKFWQLLPGHLEIMKDALLYHVERYEGAIPANASILYTYDAFGKCLSRADSVNELFKSRRATVSLGYIGLYKVASALFGGEWETNPGTKAFTFNIVKESKVNADAWGDEYGYHFSAHSTPGESLIDRFCRLDIEKFGIIKNITDKEYYTNSFHYGVHKNLTPFEKLEFRKDYLRCCSDRFIRYCEYPIL